MTTDYKALKDGGFMRQIQKDRFSLRLKVVGGHLSSGQLRAVSDAADRFGSGHVHLTSRQGLEIPFIALADIGAVKESLAQHGVEAGVCGPRVRTVTACQGAGVCPSGCIDTMALARRISERYFGRVLPHKFKFGVTGCRNNCLKAEENDLGVKGGYAVRWLSGPCSLCGVCAKACREGAISVGEREVSLDAQKCNHCGRCVKACPTEAWEGQSGFLVSFGGLFGNRIAQGRGLLGLLTDAEDVLRISDAALDFFDRHGRPGERFRTVVERVGWEGLAAAVGGRP